MFADYTFVHLKYMYNFNKTYVAISLILMCLFLNNKIEVCDICAVRYLSCDL